jgi:hypothetical protein
MRERKSHGPYFCHECWINYNMRAGSTCARTPYQTCVIMESTEKFSCEFKQWKINENEWFWSNVDNFPAFDFFRRQRRTHSSVFLWLKGNSWNANFPYLSSELVLSPKIKNKGNLRQIRVREISLISGFSLKKGRFILVDFSLINIPFHLLVSFCFYYTCKHCCVQQL